MLSNLTLNDFRYKGMKNATMIKYKTGEPVPDMIDAEQLNKEIPPQKDTENVGQKQNQHPPKKSGKKSSTEKGASKSEPTLKETTNVVSTAENDLKPESKTAENGQLHEKNKPKV